MKLPRSQVTRIAIFLLIAAPMCQMAGWQNLTIVCLSVASGVLLATRLEEEDEDDGGQNIEHGEPRRIGFDSIDEDDVDT